MSKPGKVTLRAATARDYYRFYGKAKPAVFAGLVVEDEQMILGIGGVYLSTDLGLCATVHRARGVRGHCKWLHRAALLTMRAFEGQGVGPIHALADDDIANSARYLERLGFVKTDRIYNEQAVYTWQK